MKKPFALKYRPRRFEDVRGQDHAVGFLSQAIKKGQRGYNVLLHGQVGSGKTSLVRIYEMALNCEQPTVTGSPCLECNTCCMERSKVGLKEYDVSGRGDADFEDWFNGNYETPTEYKWQVLFLDEAHSLSKQASDFMLKRLEDSTKDNVIVCLATTEFDRVRAALRSRLMKLEVRALPPAQSIELLRYVAQKENIEFDPDGLALLAGIAGNQPRDLLNTLEEVSVTGNKLTESFVRECLDVDQKPALLAYFEALARGDLAAEVDALNSWREKPADQARWIVAFLLSLYYNNIQNTTLIVEAITHSIQAERKHLLKQFQTKFGVGEVSELAPYWRGMLGFWRDGIPAKDVAAQLKLTLFRSLIVDTPDQLIDDWTTRQVPGRARSVRAHTKPEIVEWQDTSEFLTPAGARTIIDLASMLVQEYGVGFNVAVELAGIAPSVDEAALREATGNFLSQLASAADLPDSDAFAYLAILERLDGNPRALVVAHLPYRKDEELGAWCARVDETLEAARPGSFKASPRLSRQRPSRSGVNWSFHWTHVLNLCLGVVDEPSGGIPFAKLKIPEGRRRAPGPINGGLLLRSSRLAQPRVKELADEGLAPFRPAQEGAWENVRGKWELKEFATRRKLRQERDEKLEDLKAAYGDDETGLKQALNHADAEWRERVRERTPPWAEKA